MATNTFSVTDFVSQTLGTYYVTHDKFYANSYHSVLEYNDANRKGYAVGQNLRIKYPGYGTAQTGLAVTPLNIQDQTQNYVFTENDIYTYALELDIRELNLDVVGQKAAFTTNPFADPDNAQARNPQAKTVIDNYAIPGGRVLMDKVNTIMAGKLKTAAWYTPVDVPAKLGNVNNYDSIASVETLADELGFMQANRCAFMNSSDYQSVASSLSNQFDIDVQRDIIRDAKYTERSLASFKFLKAVTVTNTDAAPQFSFGANIVVDSVASDGSTITFSGLQPSLTPAITAGTLISIPSVNLINRTSKKVLETRLVVCAAADANSDGGGIATVLLSDPIIAAGFQANVDALPIATAPAELFPAHRNSYFSIPMGLVMNAIPLAEIFGADNGRWNGPDGMFTQSYYQGVARNGQNDFLMRIGMATLAMPRYLIRLPSQIA